MGIKRRRRNNENDVLFTNMWLLRNNFIFGNESIIRKRFSNDLRVFVHNFISTPTSPAVKQMTGLDWIPSYFSNLKRKYKGMQLEHINEVKVLADKYIKLALDKNYDLDKQKVREMALKDYRAVYKLSKTEPLEGADAEIYLSRFQ
ncbi:MAG: hypothetical protein ACON30_08605 [Flavobacteriaceae bacterium]